LKLKKLKKNKKKKKEWKRKERKKGAGISVVSSCHSLTLLFLCPFLLLLLPVCREAR